MEVKIVAREVLFDSSEAVVVSFWEVVDLTKIIVVEGRREDVEVTVSVGGDVDGGA